MIPYKEIIREIQHYIGWSQRICVEYNRNGITLDCWQQTHNNLCGGYNSSNGLFPQNEIEYQVYLTDCKRKGYQLAKYDSDFIRSLLDLIHLTHTADNGDVSYPYPSHCSWQGDPLVIALSWLKWIYEIYPDECKELVKEYRDNNKMIPDNINVGYEVWADSILSVRKAIRIPKEKRTMIEKIKDNSSYSYIRTQTSLIDDKLIWSGSKADLTRWLRGMPIKGIEKPLKPIIDNKNGHWDWVSVNGLFSVNGKCLTSDELRKIAEKAK